MIDFKKTSQKGIMCSSHVYQVLGFYIEVPKTGNPVVLSQKGEPLKRMNKYHKLALDTFLEMGEKEKSLHLWCGGCVSVSLSEMIRED